MVRLIRASYIDFKNASSAVGPWRLLGSQRKSQLPGLGLQRVYQRGAVVLQGIQHGTHLSLGGAHSGEILNSDLVETAGQGVDDRFGVSHFLAEAGVEGRAADHYQGPEARAGAGRAVAAVVNVLNAGEVGRELSFGLLTVFGLFVLGALLSQQSFNLAVRQLVGGAHQATEQLLYSPFILELQGITGTIGG